MQMDREEQVAPTVETPNRSALTPDGEPDDLGRKVMAASLKAKLFGRGPGFPRCGRFEVRRQVGMGGMGVVYEGWDPDLERKVALKVLHESASESGDQRKRLVREAQTLAKLRHPNVVQVYEVGAEGGRLFIAMEYVEGETLRAWLMREDRGWKEVLEKYVEAGRGLAAAHAEGLVHRDFKPDNVMVTAKGEVRVLDFGLAREEFDPEALSLAADMRADELTQTGALLGTPIYMAPEQFAGKPADARTDQFSFCVALWEGLHGERPFHGTTLDELKERITTGAMDLPRRRDIPARVRRAILRGMSTAPAERWPAIPQLLTALTPRSSRNTWAAAVFLGTTLAGTLGTIAYLQAENANPICKPVEERLAGVWDDEVRGRLARSFSQYPEHPWVYRGWEIIDRDLTAHVDAWSADYEAACSDLAAEDADHVLAVQRVGCLESRLYEIEAMGASTADVDPKTWAAQLPGYLPLQDLQSCRDPDTVQGVPAPPRNPDVKAKVDPVQRLIARTWRILRTGRPNNALPMAERAVAQAKSVGFPATIAAAEFLLARTLRELDPDGSAENFTRALVAAEKAGDDFIVAHVLLDRAEAAPGDQIDLTHAEAVVEGMGSPRVLTSRLENDVALNLEAAGKWEEAVALRQQHLDAAVAKHGPTSPRINQQLNDLARLTEERDPERASALWARQLALMEDALGSDHPRIALPLDASGHNAILQGRPEEAIEFYERAVSILEGAFPDGNYKLGWVLYKLGESMMLTGHVQTAAELCERSDAMLARLLGPSHAPTLATSTILLTWHNYMVGDHAGALAGLERMPDHLANDDDILSVVRAVYAARRGDARKAARLLAQGVEANSLPGPGWHEAWTGIWSAHVARELGKSDEARDHADGALQVLNATGLPQILPWQRDEIRALAGQTRVEAGDHRAALAPLEQAAAALVDADEVIFYAPFVHLNLARALVETGGDRARALTLTRRAAEEFAEIGPGRAAERQEALDLAAELGGPTP